MPRKLALPHAAKAKGIFATVLHGTDQAHMADHHWNQVEGHVEEALANAISRAGQQGITVKVKAQLGFNVWQTLGTTEVSSWDIHLADGSQLTAEQREEIHLLFHSDQMPGGGQKWNFAAFYRDADTSHFARHYSGQGWGDEFKPGAPT